MRLLICAVLLFEAGMISAAAQELVTASFLPSQPVITRVAVDRQGSVYWISTTPANGSAMPLRLIKAGGDHRLRYDIQIGVWGIDFVTALKTDDAGFAYVLGSTLNPDYPLTATAPWKTHTSSSPAPFLMKIDPDGKLAYSTYIGSATGTAFDAAPAPDGTVVVIATAPVPSTSGAFRGPGCDDAGFRVLRLNPARSDAVFVACIGVAQPYALAVASTGDILVAGNTADTTFPTTPGVFQPKSRGGACSGPPLAGGSYPCPNMTVTKLSADGSRLIYSTFLGGTASVSPVGVAVDSAGNAYVAGTAVTYGTPDDFPIVVPGAASPKGAPVRALPPIPMPMQPVVAKISPSADELIYSIKVPARSITSIDLASSGRAVITGGASDDTPRTGGSGSKCGLTELQQQGGGYVAEVNDSAQLQNTAILPSTVPASAITDGPITTVAAWTSATAPVTPGGLLPSSDLLILWQAAFELSKPSVLACVANGASYVEATRFAPGELITLYGAGLGPADLQIAHADENGLFPTELGGTRVLFDGAPGAILASSSNQVNAAVPYSLAGKESSVVEVEVNGNRAAPRLIQIAPANPTVLLGDVNTRPGYLDTPGAVRNENESVNTDENYAYYKSTVSIFVTGLGVAVPDAADRGAGTGAPFTPALPLHVFMNFNEADVIDVSVPAGMTNSVVRIRARVPDICCGGRLPLQVSVGESRSPQGPYIVVH